MTLVTDLKAIEERECAASPGPWTVAPDSVVRGMNRIWATVQSDPDDPQDGATTVDVACCEGDGSLSRDETRANEAFIAAARTDVKVLVEMVHALIEESGESEINYEQLWIEAKQKAGAR